MSANAGRLFTGLIDGVNDAVEIDLAGAPGATFWLQNAASLAGLTLVPEIRFGNQWFTGTMYLSNQTASTPVAVSAALSAVPAYALYVQGLGADAVRLRASAITGGSVTLNGVIARDGQPTPR